MLARVPPPASCRHRQSGQNRHARRSMHVACLGRYFDAISALLQVPPTTPSITSLAQLQPLPLTAHSMLLLHQPTFDPPVVNSAHLLCAILSSSRGSAAGWDGKRSEAYMSN